jgi:hypothetical protein
MLFWSWEVCHIFPTYDQILTISKFVSSKFVGGMIRTVKPFLSVICCVNTFYIEYPYSLDLLVSTIRDYSDTGTQI